MNLLLIVLSESPGFPDKGFRYSRKDKNIILFTRLLHSFLLYEMYVKKFKGDIGMRYHEGTV
jgi:hypothetical protein